MRKPSPAPQHSAVTPTKRIKQLCCMLACLFYACASPAQEQASPEQLRFVTTNAEFTLLHEMGHLLIHELKLPVLGREEDAADQLGFIGLFLIHNRQQTPDFPMRLLDVADYWRLEWQSVKNSTEQIQAWDSHALDEQRFYNIACLAYGSDPKNLEWIIEMTGLPEERAFYCQDEYEQAKYAALWFREHFKRTANQPIQHRIQVIYEPPPYHLEGGNDLLEKVKASGELEAVAERASTFFALPRDLTLRIASCGAPDSWYNTNSGELTLCYERIAYFRKLARQLPRLNPHTD
ncbi:MAG: DUF4344 domain-containing metallopeptidase [Pseudomonas sp.]|nr:DUF4344 domain-containing metallopeptidase [Pseudomonas sp.]